MTGGEHSRCQAPLDEGRKLHEAQRVGDLRPRPRNPLRQLGVGAVEVLQQLMVNGHLLQQIELNAMEVLQQGDHREAS